MTDTKNTTRESLADTYLKLINGQKPYPPLNGYSPFIQGSGYNKDEFVAHWYGDIPGFDLFVYTKEKFSQVWIIEDIVRSSAEYAMNEYLDDKAHFGRREKYMRDSIEKLDKIYREYTYGKISQTSNSELLILGEKIRRMIWDVNGAVFFSIYLDKPMCMRVLKNRNYALSEAKLDLLWEKAIEPAFESFDKSQEISLLECLSQNKTFEDIVEDSQYIMTDYHSAKTIKEVEDYLKQHHKKLLDNQNGAIETLKAEKDHIDHVAITHKEWIASLPQHEAEIAEYLQIVMRIRDRRKNFFAKGLTIIYRIAEKMFAEVGLERSLIPYITMPELFLGIENLKLQQEDIRRRVNGFELIVPHNSDQIISYADTKESSEKMNAYYKACHIAGSEEGVIKGQSAFKGIIRGKVRIVATVRDNNFLDGEILVTGMTRPEFVPLMKKAIAIVTDEGGITCHAAIVSRELKKPCVIGTKIATKVLKDGDMVEVDAEKGVVRIIK